MNILFIDSHSRLFIVIWIIYGGHSIWLIKWKIIEFKWNGNERFVLMTLKHVSFVYKLSSVRCAKTTSREKVFNCKKVKCIPPDSLFDPIHVCVCLLHYKSISAITHHMNHNNNNDKTSSLKNKTMVNARCNETNDWICAHNNRFSFIWIIGTENWSYWRAYVWHNNTRIGIKDKANMLNVQIVYIRWIHL